MVPGVLSARHGAASAAAVSEAHATATTLGRPRAARCRRQPRGVRRLARAFLVVALAAALASASSPRPRAGPVDETPGARLAAAELLALVDRVAVRRRRRVLDPAVGGRRRRAAPGPVVRGRRRWRPRRSCSAWRSPAGRRAAAARRPHRPASGGVRVRRRRRV